MMITCKLPISIAVMVLGSALCNTAIAADYYVAQNGNNGNAGTQAQPWGSIQYAASILGPGDTVYVRGGTYSEYVQINRGGTKGLPVTFKAYVNETPVVTVGGANGGIRIGAGNVVIDGITVTGTNANGQGGGISIFDVSDTNSDITVQNCIIYNNSSSDNAAGVYIVRNLGNITIKNNVIHSNKGTVAVNETGITIFGIIGSTSYSNVIIANNEIYDQGVGIKYKHPTGSNGLYEVKNNVVHDIYSRAAIETVQNGTKIHNNIVYNATATETSAIRVGVDYDANGAEVANNSIYNAYFGVLVQPGSTNTSIHDNIFYTMPNSGLQGVALMIGNTTTTTSDYNLFFNGSVVSWGGYSSWNSNTAILSLAQLKTKGLDTHSLQADPRYVSLVPTRNFHLQAGSPASGKGSTGQDIGAYNVNIPLGTTFNTVPPLAPIPFQVM